MAEKLECKIRTDDSITHVLSPSVGNITWVVKPGQMVSGGQIIARITRLGKIFEVIVPADVSGRVQKINSAQNLGYLEILMTLEAISESSKVHQSALAATPYLSIKSTMDGMFYLSSSPQTPPFVSVGENIVPGQTIGLIEVMKCFYPMKYQGAASVKIIDVLVGNGTPVNSGMEIFRISP